MDTEASAIDRPDPAIVAFIESSRLVSPGGSARFERLPGGVSSDIWLVHADERSFCIKRALAQLRVNRRLVSTYRAQFKEGRAGSRRLRVSCRRRFRHF